MKPIQRILVAVERSPHAQGALEKAVVLARHFGASIELFLCDAERAFALNHDYVQHGVERARQACVADSREYLNQLRSKVDLSDVECAIDAVCETPEYESIVRKVRRSRPDLVIRGVGGGGQAGPNVLSPSDWDVIRACPALILLTRGKAWASQPKIAAAVDISAEETPEFARAILQTAQRFAAPCAGELEVLHCIAHPAFSSEIEAQRHELYDFADRAGVRSSSRHICAGDPLRMLPMVARNKSYDIVVLGALTHQKTLSAMVGSVTGKMLDALDCDFLLVKPAAHAAVSSVRTPDRAAREASSVDAAAL
jgi:universal stress protein E